MGDQVALPGEYPQSKEQLEYGGEMSILEVSHEVAQEWYAFLRRQDVALSYDAFIRWALREASQLLAECADDGSAWCMTHESPMEPYVMTTDDIVSCDAQRAAFD